MDLKQILEKKRQLVQTPVKSRISTRNQVEAVYVWENMLDKKISLPLLMRLAKLNLSVFLKAKDYLYGMQKDGMPINNKVSYFLWLYKSYKNKTI